MARLTAKAFIKKVVKEHTPLRLLLRRLQAPQNTLEISLRVYRPCPHYVHERSTSAEFDVEQGTASDRMLLTFLRVPLDRLLYTLNHQLAQELYRELEDRTSDRAVAEDLDANEMYFDKVTGDFVDKARFVTVDQLSPTLMRKVLAQSVEGTQRDPQEAFHALRQGKVLFDERGRKVDSSAFGLVSELPDDVRFKVIDKYRTWSVEDDTWSQAVEDDWVNRLEALGFRGVEIAYNLGYSQSSGASFTAKSAEAEPLVQHLVQQEETQAHTQSLVQNQVG